MPTPTMSSSKVASNPSSHSYTVASLSSTPGSQARTLVFHKEFCAWILLDQIAMWYSPVPGQGGGGTCGLAHSEVSESPSPGVESSTHQSCGLWEGAFVLLNPHTVVRRCRAQLSTFECSLPFFLSQSLTLWNQASFPTCATTTLSTVQEGPENALSFQTHTILFLSGPSVSLNISLL